jgi:hypothetical protein
MRIGRARPVRFCFFGSAKKGAAARNFRPPAGLSDARRTQGMLVERGLQVMNVEAVGEAYAIASNYLRRSGAIADNLVTNEQLLAIIVQLFQRGEFNKIRLANKAIAQFEAAILDL